MSIKSLIKFIRLVEKCRSDLIKNKNYRKKINGDFFAPDSGSEWSWQVACGHTDRLAGSTRSVVKKEATYPAKLIFCLHSGNNCRNKRHKNTGILTDTI